MRRWHLQVISVLTALTCAVGCGSGNTQPITPSQPVFLYAVVNTAPPPSNPSFELQAFEFDPATNTLSSKSTVPLGFVAGMAIDPSGKFLYASSLNTIQKYSIDSATGALQSAGASNLTQICAFCQPISGPGALTFSSDGKFLYYGSSSGGSVTQVVGALAVDSTGSLSPVPGSPFLADQTPVLVGAHPSGRFVITENTPGYGVFPFPMSSMSVFVVDPNTGALSEATGSPLSSAVNADVVGLAIHPSGKFVYASTGVSANGVLGWGLDQTTGALNNLSGSPALPGATTFGGAFHPSGNFLYVSAGSAGGIYGLRVDPNTGALTSLANSPFLQGVILLDPTVDASGKFLFAVDSLNKAIVTFAIDSAGMLTKVGSPAAINGIPGQLAASR